MQIEEPIAVLETPKKQEDEIEPESQAIAKEIEDY